MFSSPTRRGMRGLAQSTQWALLAPLALLTIFSVINVSIVMHARSVAQYAALAGAEQAGLYRSDADSARQVANQIVTNSGLDSAEISVAISSQTVVVEVRAYAQTVLGSHAVHAKASRSREH